MEVRAPALDNSDARVEARCPADEHVLKLNGRIGFAPSASSRFKVEVVPTQIQAGAGSEFEKAQREAGLPCDADRKSTRLNSSHGYISYAVFCLKKKKKTHRRKYISVLIIKHLHVRARCS